MREYVVGSNIAYNMPSESSSIYIMSASSDKLSYPFGNSRISVGVGNTIVSFAFFGVGPSVAAYAILKVLEENEETERIIPFSSPITLPATALLVYQVMNLNAWSLLAAGAIYMGYMYLRGNPFPSQLSTTFKKWEFPCFVTTSIMWNVSSFISKFIQKSRYTIQDSNNTAIYTVYLPEGTTKVVAGSVRDE